MNKASVKHLLRLILASGILLSCQQVWATALPSSPVQDAAPFNDPDVHELGTGRGCGGAQPMDCMHLDETQILATANACVRRFYGFSADYMTEFRTYGDYTNCAVPTGYQPPGRGMSGKAQWPVCCVIDNGEGACTMECHYMYVEDK